jgi:hypothetical protein
LEPVDFPAGEFKPFIGVIQKTAPLTKFHLLQMVSFLLFGDFACNMIF